MDPECPDQGKQTKRVHAPEGIRPLKLSVPGANVSGKDVVDMGDGGYVPGITGLRACAETAGVVDEVANNHFDDLRGESGGGRRVCRRDLRGRTP